MSLAWALESPADGRYPQDSEDKAVSFAYRVELFSHTALTSRMFLLMRSY